MRRVGQRWVWALAHNRKESCRTHSPVPVEVTNGRNPSSSTGMLPNADRKQRINLKAGANEGQNTHNDTCTNAPELCELGLIDTDHIVVCLGHTRKLILQVLDGTICIGREAISAQCARK